MIPQELTGNLSNSYDFITNNSITNASIPKKYPWQGIQTDSTNPDQNANRSSLATSIQSPLLAQLNGLFGGVSNNTKPKGTFMNFLGADSPVKGSKNSDIIGQGIDTLDSATGLKASQAKKNSNATNAMNTAYDATSDVLMKIPDPTGTTKLIGGAMKLNGLASDALGAMGIRTDQKTGVDKVLGSKLLATTPIGIVNNAFGKSTNKVADSDIIESNAGFKGTTSAINDDKKEEGRYGLFSWNSFNKAKKDINNINSETARISSFLTKQNDYKKGMENTTGDRNLSYQKKLAGFNGSQAVKSIFAKHGAVLSRKEEPKKNVIPEGALHKNLHHLDKIDENLEDVTRKGIPVISIEDGDVLQHAEIEHSELILTKELTEKLEELRKIGTEEAKIEAGKLLTEEIILNTDDKTNKLLSDENGVLLACDGAKMPLFKSKKKLGFLGDPNPNNKISEVIEESNKNLNEDKKSKINIKKVEKYKKKYLDKDEEEKESEVSSLKDGKWIQKAVNPKHKGYCTPMTKKTCTPHRKALAKRFKKMAKERKKKK